MTRKSQTECQICYPKRCTNYLHWEPRDGRKEYIVCPDCGSDQLIYETERSIEDAYLRCECGWVEYEPTI